MAASKQSVSGDNTLKNKLLNRRLLDESPPCVQCAGEGILTWGEGQSAHAELCPCKVRCQLCSGTRYVFTQDSYGREFAEPCQCEVLRRRAQLFTKARIPGKYVDARLKDTPLAAKDPHGIYSSFRLLVQDYQRGQKGILLVGPPGVGKTWLVAACVYELIYVHGISVMFRDFFHLLADLRAGYSQEQPESELLAPLHNVEVLVIDELGKGRNTPWEINILDSIISHRYNTKRTTLFTSNYTESVRTTLEESYKTRSSFNPTERQTTQDTLQDRVGSRIYSRLKEMCDVIELQGPDRRLQE